MNLTHLEAKLRTLFEDQLSSLLLGYTIEDQIINKLSSALKENLAESADRGNSAPNVITLIVAPEYEAVWRNPQVIHALQWVYETAVQEADLKVENPPVITVTVDTSFSGKQLSVLASHKIEIVEETKGMPKNSEKNKQEEDKSSFPDNAFLIVEGVKVFPLKEAVINIGRRLENQLVIDDPRISRNHAQLRAINGRFVLFDLNSTGGSFVNTQRTNQTVLYPGDVISLAGVALIFGQDNPPPRPDLNDTSPFRESDQKDRPTATLEQNTVDLQTDRLTRDKKSNK